MALPGDTPGPQRTRLALRSCSSEPNAAQYRNKQRGCVLTRLHLWTLNLSLIQSSCITNMTVLGLTRSGNLEG